MANVTNEDFEQVEKKIDDSRLTKKQRRVFHDIVGLMRKAEGIPKPEPAPEPAVLTSATPASGAEGDEITLTGTGFTGATGVKFGTEDGDDFNVVDDTEITVKVPAMSDGVTTAQVLSPNGDSNTIPFEVEE